jgi:hypothetical protein
VHTRDHTHWRMCWACTLACTKVPAARILSHQTVHHASVYKSAGCSHLILCERVHIWIRIVLVCPWRGACADAFGSSITLVFEYHAGSQVSEGAGGGAIADGLPLRLPRQPGHLRQMVHTHAHTHTHTYTHTHTRTHTHTHTYMRGIHITHKCAGTQL